MANAKSKTPSKTPRTRVAQAVAATQQPAPVENPTAGTAFDTGQHTFKLEGQAALTYTDADIQVFEAAYSALKVAESQCVATCDTLCRLFGRDWLDTDSDKGKTARTTIRAFLMATLPEARDFTARLSAAQQAAGGRIPPTDPAHTAFVAERRAISNRFDRILSVAGQAQRESDALNSGEPITAKARSVTTVTTILDKACEALDKRAASKSAKDADACRAASMLIGQIQRGRAQLFGAIMQAGARLSLKDEAMLRVLRFMDGEDAARILAKADEHAKAQAAAPKAEVVQIAA